MRAIVRAVVFVAGLSCASLTANAVTPLIDTSILDAATRQSSVEQVQYWRGNYCERLRRACVYRDERGERGEGNCRRYRDECGSGPSYCERLRRACEYKDERGEWGQGNCRRYRDECGGRGRY